MRYTEHGLRLFGPVFFGAGCLTLLNAMWAAKLLRKALRFLTTGEVPKADTEQEKKDN